MTTGTRDELRELEGVSEQERAAWYLDRLEMASGANRHGSMVLVSHRLLTACVRGLRALLASPPEAEGATLYRNRCGWCGAYEGTVDPTEPCAKDETGYIGPHQFGVYEPVSRHPKASPEGATTNVLLTEDELVAGSPEGAGEPDAWVSVETVKRFQKEGRTEGWLHREPGPALLSDGYIPVYFGHPAPTEDALRDRERLDWLEANGVMVDEDGGWWTICVPHVVGPDVEYRRSGRADTLREAIDAARTTERTDG